MLQLAGRALRARPSDRLGRILERAARGSSACRSIRGSASGSGMRPMSLACRACGRRPTRYSGSRRVSPGPRGRHGSTCGCTPYLADHRVQRAAIMPAAAYLEVAFAAGPRRHSAASAASCGKSPSPIRASSQPINRYG